MRIVLSLLTVVVVMALFLLILRSKKTQEDQKRIARRIEHFSTTRKARPGMAGYRRKENQPKLAEQLRRFIRQAGVRLQRIQKEHRMDDLMDQADWPLLGSEFEVIMALLGALCAILAFVITLKWLWALVGFVGGAAAAYLYLQLSIKRRQKAFVNQLGDMLTMVANALRAGFSFLQAFELVAKEMDAPIGVEVRKVMNEINVGVTLEDALENMQRRVQSPDFELIVTAVLIQRQGGGNLAQILDTISGTIQERIRMRREVKALTAQGRASGVVLTLIPIFLALILQVISPSYLEPLFTNPIGQMAIGGAVVLAVIGYIVIMRSVYIKL